MSAVRTPAERFIGASPQKGRGRPLDATTINLINVLSSVIEEQHPTSVRGAYYLASVRGAVPKTQQGYNKVQGLLVKMREREIIPWGWISDGTRWRRGATTYDGVEEALRQTASLYRRSLWDHADELVEVWLEKEALAGVILPVTMEWTVDLMVCRGYPSLSFLHGAADHQKRSQKPLTIYYLGDLDPSGKDIPRFIRDRLGEFGADFELIELAVTTEQVESWGLPTRPTKKTDTRAKDFDGESVELDAIPPGTLRELVEGAISQHLDQWQVQVLETYEREEREQLYKIAEMVG
jgi:hypothetical protein